MARASASQKSSVVECTHVDVLGKKCTKPFIAKGLCSTHYKRIVARKSAHPDREVRAIKSDPVLLQQGRLDRKVLDAVEAFGQQIDTEVYTAIRKIIEGVFMYWRADQKGLVKALNNQEPISARGHSKDLVVVSLPRVSQETYAQIQSLKKKLKWSEAEVARHVIDFWFINLYRP